MKTDQVQARGAGYQRGWRFAIDFAGGKLPLLTHDARVDRKLKLSRGSAETASCRPLEALVGFRTIFDLVPDEFTDPINIKPYLEFDDVPLSEARVLRCSPPLAARRL